MTDPIIQLRNVSQRFGDKIILDDVDLDVYPDQAVGVIGPSGTGKSTILRIVAGLQAPDSGTVMIHGHQRQRAIEQGEKSLGVGLVFQQSALFDSLTVDENIGFSLYRDPSVKSSQVRALVEETLELVGLPGIGDRFPAELSGGMRKRVSLARAIIAHPSQVKEHRNILLYDEPTAGLDPVASTRVETLIKDLLVKEKACCCHLIVTHQFSTIDLTTDRIIFLYQGKIQWDGSTEAAYKSDHPLLKQFFSKKTF
ncbi:MAG: ABC transporter ATP-binding protein [Prochlorothrix sp.]